MDVEMDWRVSTSVHVPVVILEWYFGSSVQYRRLLRDSTVCQ